MKHLSLSPVMLAVMLAGCASTVQRPAGYSPVSYSPAWAPSYNVYSPPALPPAVVVLPRQQQPYQAPAPEPYRPAPVAVGQPAAVPEPLRPVDPPDSHALDDSCVGYWRLCHFVY